jgi:hypothetical protein
MIGIIRKDMLIYIVYIAVFTSVQLFSYRFSSFEHLSYSVTVFSFFCFLVSALPAISNEYSEKLNSGYTFMKTLPVTDADVISAKFLLLLAAVIIYTAVTWYNLRKLPATPDELELARVWLVLNSAAGITVAGLIYVLVFRFRLSYLMMILSAGLGGVIAGYITMSEMLARGRFDHLLPLLRRAAGVGWVLIALSGVVAWFVLMQVSIWLKRRCYV